MCKSWCELIIALVVIVFSLWQTMYSKWILVIAGIVLLVHSFSCKTCFMGNNAGMSKSKNKKK